MQSDPCEAELRPFVLKIALRKTAASPHLGEEKGVRAPRMPPCTSGVDLWSEHVFLSHCIRCLVYSKLSHAGMSNFPLE